MESEDLDAEPTPEEIEPEASLEEDAPDATVAWLDDDESEEAAEPAPASKAIVPAKEPRALAPTKPTGLAQADLLQRYMSEVSRHPLLSRDEETRLARAYVETGDPKLAYRLVTANLRLVVKIAWEYRRAAFNLLDLIQEGNVGLMQAVRKYDPERGVKLSSYAAWWIRAYIIRYLMDNWRMVKLGTTQAQRKIFFNLRREKEKLAAQGFDPEPRLLAEKLNVSEQDVVEMDRRLGGDEISLETPMLDGSSLTYADRLAQSEAPADETLAERELQAMFRQKLAEFGKGLKDKEKFIFEKRLTADEPLTLQEVGNEFGVTRERARQIEAKLVSRLKAFMQEHLPDFDRLSMEARDE